MPYAPSSYNLFPFTYATPLDSVADIGLNLFQFHIQPTDSYLSYEGWMEGLTVTGGNMGFIPMQAITSFYKVSFYVLVSSGSCTDRF